MTIATDNTPLAIDARKRNRLRALSQPPVIAWPSVILTGICVTCIYAVYILGFSHLMPLWAGCLINVVAGYLLFSVIHDAIHRSISSNFRLNDWCGRLAATSMSPGSTLGLFRWGHIQHHRHTSASGDPDNWLHGGPTWVLPLRWMVIDVYYLVFVTFSADKIGRRYLKAGYIGITVTTVILAVLLASGFWLELLVLWFIPSRLVNMALGFTFFWLPHAHHHVSAAHNRYCATTVRIGHEWLNTPLLQYQNYHLLHHLYPRAPFYNMIKLWHLLEPELRQHTLAIQDGFAIQPDIRQPGEPLTHAPANAGFSRQ